MSEEEPLELDCDIHGKGIAACVCQHLLQDSRGELEFVENSDTPGDLQAWCNLCEEEFLAEGEMTERFREFNGLRLVCERCYETIRARCAG